MRLCDALGVDAGDVVAIVGGGGKTAALYRLGAELAERSVPVLLCGTTRFTPPEEGDAPNLLMVESADDLLRAFDPAQGLGPARAITAATGWGSKGRLLPLEPDWLDTLHRARPGVAIVAEADGSAMRPFKAPGEHEPVIPACATLVVAVAGMDAAGRPLDETHVHRPERVAALTGATLGDPVTPAVIAAVLAHPDGGRKHVPPAARWIALLNKADTLARRVAADQTAAALRDTAERIVIAQLKREPPILDVKRRT